MTPVTLLSSITDFESSVRQRHPGAGREARLDADQLAAMGLIIVEAHRLLERMYNTLGSARDFRKFDGTIVRGTYRLEEHICAEIDYIDLSPEAEAVIRAQVAQLMGDA